VRPSPSQRPGSPWWVTLGAATMLVLTGTGVLLPGYAAVKRADISALERAGL